MKNSFKELKHDELVAADGAYAALWKSWRDAD